MGTTANTTAPRYAQYVGRTRTHAKTRYLRLHYYDVVRIVKLNEKTAIVRPLENILHEPTSEFSHVFTVKLDDLRDAR